MSIGYPLYHISNIDCVCHCHYEWNCIIGTTCFIFDRLNSYIWYLKLKCTIHARGRLLVPPYVCQLCYEWNSLVPSASCLIDWTAVSGIWIKCTTHARGRSHVTDFKLWLWFVVITSSVYLNIKSPTIYTVRDINKGTLLMFNRFIHMVKVLARHKSVGST